MNDITDILISLGILLFSVIFHEVAHGLMAYRLGDSTAKYAGRLTLNPIPHIDLWGSILLPGMLLFLSRSLGVPLPIIGAAKPVPVNYSNLKDVRSGMFLVSAVGPLTNVVLAVVTAAVYRLSPELSEMGQRLLLTVIELNLFLAAFNLLPIPPLDGSKILASIFGYFNHNLMYSFLELERYGFILVFGILFLFPSFIGSVLIPPVMTVMQFLIGHSLPMVF